MRDSIIFLGPEGATFSYEAYKKLSEIYKAPNIEERGPTVSVLSNESILSWFSPGDSMYGVMAMETKAQGKVVEPIESFIGLLNKKECPVQVLGAIKMRLHFALMAKKGMKKEKIETVIAHPKALGACAGKIRAANFRTMARTSNGQAAEDIAENSQFKKCAALAPRVAAEKYGLHILEENFEDGEAITTFFLLGSRGIPKVRKENRALIVFRAKHKAGALVNVLTPFKRAQLNLIHIHSAYTELGGYDFAIELDITKSEIPAFNVAVKEFCKKVSKSLVFGPFGIVEV